MSNEFKHLNLHSAQYFDDVRDHWWNEDYLRWLSSRWRVEGIRSALDVGCGVGHWGRLIGRTLPEACIITGVDREALWAEKATERAAAAGLSGRFKYQAGCAEELPFPDNSFDMVTCQTVLMHLREPEVALREMLRVLRPGGLVLVTEPNHIVQPVLADAVALKESPESAAALLRFQLHCHRGKAAVGEGNDLIGESLPALFASAGLRDVEIRMNDRVNPFVPPYDTAQARSQVEQLEDLIDRDHWMWNRATTLRYFVAGGGRAEDFERHWGNLSDFLRRIMDAITAGTYHGAGGGIVYIGWGRKPETPG